MLLGTPIDNHEVETTEGKLKLHDYQGDSWLLLMSHPADFTPVCTTELSRAASLANDFAKRNVKLIALSCDTVEDHKGWTGDVLKFSTADKLPYPIIADPKRDLATKFGMMDPDEKDAKGVPLTCRACMVIDPKHKLRLSILYPASTGRNFNEVLRIIDSLQLGNTGKYVTPCEWTPGSKVLIPPCNDSKDYKTKVETESVPSGKGYMRYTTAE